MAHPYKWTVAKLSLEKDIPYKTDPDRENGPQTFRESEPYTKIHCMS